MRGSYLLLLLLLFFLFFFSSNDNIWESIIAVGEFYELYGVGWIWRDCIWLSMGGPSIHIMLGFSEAMHVDVLVRHVHCIGHSEIVMSSGRLQRLPTFIRVSL